MINEVTISVERFTELIRREQRLILLAEAVGKELSESLESKKKNSYASLAYVDAEKVCDIIGIPDYEDAQKEYEKWKEKQNGDSTNNEE